MKHPPRNLDQSCFDWQKIILQKTDLPSNAKFLAMYLASYMNINHDVAWPSQKTIERETGLSHPTVLKYLDLLISEGWISKQSGDRVQSNRYWIAFPKEVGSSLTYVTSEEKVGKEVTSNNNIITNTLSKRFTPPSLEELIAYQEEANISFDPVNFIDYWASIGWKRGRTQMKDWKATARNWARNESNGQNRPRSNTSQNQPKLTPAQRIAEKRRQLAAQSPNMGVVAENGGDVRTYLDESAG